jgi:hypothetical protein
MTTHERAGRQYRMLPDDEPSTPGASEAPSFSRSWIRVRSAWRHPVEVFRLVRLWRGLKRQLDAASGLRSFEYRLRLRPFMIGMHVVWDRHRDEIRFAETSAHGAVASWAKRSSLIPAFRFEHFALDGDRIVRLGGFWLFEDEGDIPADAALPLGPATANLNKPPAADARAGGQ